MKQKEITTNIWEMPRNKNKNQSWLIKILAVAIIVFFNGTVFGGVVMAQFDEDIGPGPGSSECTTKAESQYNADVQECENQYNNAKGDCCEDFEPGTTEREQCEDMINQPYQILTCINTAYTTYQKCLLTADKNKSEAIKKCESSDDSAFSEGIDCGDGKIQNGEECDDSEGHLSENIDKYLNWDEKKTYEKQKNQLKLDSCFRCKYVDVTYEFNVSRYLQVPEGQTYLDKTTNTETGVSLQRGVIYFLVTGIEFATKIISAFALLFIIVGGIVLMVSSGNSSLQQKGKRLVLYSVLGLVIAFLSLIIVTAVQSIFYTT